MKQADKDRRHILLNCIKATAVSIDAHAEDVTETHVKELQDIYDALGALQKEIVFGEKKKTKYTWSDPYYGISHYGPSGADRTWVTVYAFSCFAILSIKRPGRTFRPECRKYMTVESAKEVGEVIVDNS
jgi:hypothetical protein